MNTTPSIILVHPQLAENVGMAARAMMNCNLYDLRLVAPRENHLSAKAVSASSGAEEILQQAKIYASVPEAIADLQQVFATTARHRHQTKTVYTAEKAASEMTSGLLRGQKCGLMFGPERTGLENGDVSFCDAIINIPLNPKHCSLNLSQAVLLVGYEFYKQQIDAPAEQFITNDTVIADKEKLQHFYEFLEKELDNCHSFSIDEKRPRMLRNLRNIFSRNRLTEQELNTLYGIINYLKQPRQK